MWVHAAIGNTQCSRLHADDLYSIYFGVSCICRIVFCGGSGLSSCLLSMVTWPRPGRSFVLRAIRQPVSGLMSLQQTSEQRLTLLVALAVWGTISARKCLAFRVWLAAVKSCKPQHCWWRICFPVFEEDIPMRSTSQLWIKCRGD